MLKNKLRLFWIIIISIMAISSCVFAEDEVIEQNNAGMNQITSAENEEMLEQHIEEIIQEGSEKNIVKGDQYKIGQEITLNETIDGNVYVMAQNVTINSQILGNAFICAENITIAENGYITNSLFAAGKNITIKGIAYDLYSVAENTIIEGYIYRDIHIATENFSLIGTIGRDASIAANRFLFEKNENNKSKIYGNLDYSAKEEKQFPENVVEGKIKYTKTEDFIYKPNYLLLAVTSLALIIVTWLILKWIAPKFEEKAGKIVKEKTLKTAGIGILGLMAIPTAAVLLMIMVVTAKAGLLLLTIYLLMAVLAKVFFIIALNNILAQKFKLETFAKTFILLLVTSIVALGLTYMPYVGGLFALAYVFMGFGIMISNLVFKREKEVE